MTKNKPTPPAIKFIGQVVVGFLKMGTPNLAGIANAMESCVKSGSDYKQIQRFLKSFR
jgi:hypothetical protein